MSDIIRRADAAQYRSEPMPEAAKNGPQVTLLNATPDPLGSIAALCNVYKGKINRSLSEVTDEERRKVLADMQATVLNGPLEAVQFQFLIEGVGRDFTHQAVRGRHAFYAQESLRFAVKENWAEEIPYPPSIAEDSEANELAREQWELSMWVAERSYGHLMEMGMPAEDARKVLPHAVTTRYQWVCSLRELLHVAGVRTCTQAQFMWKLVMAGIAKELRSYRDHQTFGDMPDDGWQFNLLADALRPACYQTGRCTFKAQFDRACKIRDRVDMNERAGRPSDRWSEQELWEVPEFGVTVSLPAINPAEWATDPGAARS